MHDCSIAKRAKFQRATGESPSYAFLADEIISLDKINIFAAGSASSDPDPGSASPRRIAPANTSNPTAA